MNGDAAPSHQLHELAFGREALPMSVEKITPVPHSPVDAPGPRPTAPPVFVALAATAANAPSSSFESGGAVNFFDSISLPLPGQTRQETSPSAPLPLGASYAREAMLANLERLVDGRLPQSAIVFETAALLGNVARNFDAPIDQLIAQAPITNADALPSRNTSGAMFTWRSQFLTIDDDGALQRLDFYLTRLSARQWEAAAFLRSIDCADSGFPYSQPPIDLYRLVIDPTTGLILACAAQSVITHNPTLRPIEQTRALLNISYKAMYVVILVAITFIFARTLSSLIAVCFFVTALAVVINMRAEPFGGGATNATRSRRRRP